MEKKHYIPHALCLILVLLTIGALWAPRTITGRPTAPVTLKLPESIGRFEAESIGFCQNDNCAMSFELSKLDDPTRCPHCGAALDRISVGEQTLLPQDTPIFRKRYSAPDGREITVTVVFSGIERRSIHKPQVCLKAQGNSIRNESTLSIDIPGRNPLNVRLLDIGQRIKTPGGSVLNREGLYCYWFFNPEYETCLHTERLARMAADNIFRSYRPRWAYVIVATDRKSRNGKRDMREIKAFIPRLMPTFTDVRSEMLRREGRNPETVLEGLIQE